MAEYQNPQQEPGGEKRLLLVFLVTFIAMLAAQPLLKKYFPQPAAPTPQQSQSAQTKTVPASAPIAPAVAVPAGVTKQAGGEIETVIENDLYRITFTNKGAQVKSWILKKYDNEAQNGQFDLVNAAAAEQFGYPLSLWTYDETLRNKLSSALYVSSREGRQTSPTDITFEYADPDLLVRKTFRFDHTYVVGVDTAVTYKGAAVAALPAWPSGFGDQTTPAFYAAGLIDYHNDISTDRTALIFPNYISRIALKSVSGGHTITGPFEWGGPSDQYFSAVFIPDDPGAAAIVTLRNSLRVPKDPDKPDSKETVAVDVIGAAVGSLRGPTTGRVFVGPKELAVLESVRVPTIRNGDPDLRGLVDFGWWGIIAKPLFVWLQWTHNHIFSGWSSGWGWAIVLQTLLISLLLLPLRITSMKSMLKMQRVAPQIKAIQEKYKKYSLRDPRKAPMNEEISALYKKEGVNPAGGCLPMLIQFPFLIAYYRMLGTALDLRHAHFLWIHDLSAADPIFLLPIFMVVSSLVNQRMTPQAGMDPQQQKMMNVMMPLMMGFIFFRLAAGLNLYYAVSNGIMIIQQAVMNRTSLGREMREMLAKRARKREK